MKLAAALLALCPLGCLAQSPLQEQEIQRAIIQLDQRSAELRADIHSLNLDAKLDQRTAELRAEIHALKAELIKWMFLFWAGTALAGLLLH